MAWLMIAGGVLAAVALAASLVRFTRGASVTSLVRLVRGCALAYTAIIVAVTLPTLAALATDGPISVEVPVRTEPVAVPDGVDFGETGPAARIEATSGGTLDLVLSGLTLQTRLLLAGGNLVMAATLVTVAFAGWRLAGALSTGRPFVAPAARAIGLAAGAVGVGGTLWSILLQLGSWNAAIDALQVTGYAILGSEASGGEAASLATLGWPEPGGFELTLDFWPLLVAIGLAAVAAVLRAGVDLSARARRLERDTAGLV